MTKKKPNITRNLFHIKSTVLGIALFGVGLYLILSTNDYNIYFVGCLLAAGVLMLFVPDKFIGQLEKLIFGSEVFFKENKKDEEKE